MDDRTPKLDPSRHHPRTFSARLPDRLEQFRFVYPVLSRRSRGISIGINPNPDKACNFDCLYCQVDRRTPPTLTKVDMPTLEHELRTLLRLGQQGQLQKIPPFDQVRPEWLALRDIAISGDAEPTTSRYLLDIVKTVVRVKREQGLAGLKIVLLTNASGLNRASVREALLWLDQHNGEVWAKLDAGTEAYYQQINKTAIPFARILENIRQTARGRPIVIQSIFVTLDGLGPPPGEIAAYCDRLRDILRDGGQIKLVQVYTLARPPADPRVAALGRAELDAIASAVRERTGLPTETYYETIS